MRHFYWRITYLQTTTIFLQNKTEWKPIWNFSNGNYSTDATKILEKIEKEKKYFESFCNIHKVCIKDFDCC